MRFGSSPATGTPSGSRLRRVVMGVDAPDGFAAGSLTAPGPAARRGELPFRHGGVGEAVLELRVHGVGGADPDVVLETPSTLQVAGDATAGFYRAWTPGADGRALPRREAYCWGGLDYRSPATALWQLLVAFMFLNLAHFALPSPRLTQRRRPADRQLRLRLDGFAKAVLRLLGLVLTLTFVATASTVLVDIVAWQAGSRPGVLPTWLWWLADWTAGWRCASAFLVVLAVLALLWVASRQGRQYERVSVPAGPSADSRFPPRRRGDWPLAAPGFWHGYLSAARQRNAHAAAGAALVTVQAAAALPSPAWRIVLSVLGFLLLAGAAVVVVSASRDRLTRRPVGPRGEEFTLADRVARLLAGAGVPLALVAVVALGVGHPRAALTFPGDMATQAALLVAQAALLVLLLGTVLVARPWRQRGPAATRPFCAGLTSPVLALLAFCVGGVFGAAVTLTVANLLGDPQVLDHGTPTGAAAALVARGTGDLYVPAGVYAFGFGAIVAVAAVAAVGVWLVAQWWSSRRYRVAAQVAHEYDAAGDAASADTRKAIASTWAWAALTDRVGPVIAVPVVLTSVAIGGYAVWAAVGAVPGALSGSAGWGASLAGLAAVAFVGRLRLALTSTAARKQVSILWDVATFWPRACHPFAPPCYAERAVPEIVDRIRRVVGDDAGGADDPAAAAGEVQWADPCAAAPIAEDHSPLLLTGYSQGTVISTAVVAQLPAAVRARVALLTLASPVRRLYGRTFPDYFGEDYLAHDLVERLGGATPGRAPRWRNLVRRSDFVGGWVLHPPASPPVEPPENPPVAVDGPVDLEIRDPVVLVPDVVITRPAVHTHFDWFQDPQVVPAADLLRDLLDG